MKTNILKSPSLYQLVVKFFDPLFFLYFKYYFILLADPWPEFFFRTSQTSQEHPLLSENNKFQLEQQQDLIDFLQWILTADPAQRPRSSDISFRARILLEKKQGRTINDFADCVAVKNLNYLRCSDDSVNVLQYVLNRIKKKTILSRICSFFFLSSQ